MDASRAAVMVVGVNLVAVWAAAAAGGRMAPPVAAAPHPLVMEQAIGDAHASLLASAGRLDAHARRAAPVTLTRDPFRFGEGRGSWSRSAGPARPVGAPDGPRAALEPAPESEPEVVLQGMAESHDGETVVRTAIVRWGRDLVLATLGTRIGGRYEVVSLGPDSVEIEDVRDRARRTVRMK
jgi:hypothetical protein